MGDKGSLPSQSSTVPASYPHTIHRCIPRNLGVVPLPIPSPVGEGFTGHEFLRRRFPQLPSRYRRPRPTSQPPGRGVPPRRDVAVQGSHRRRVGDPRLRELLQARARTHLRSDHVAVGCRRARRSGHRGRRSRPPPRRSPTPAATPPSSKNTRSCAASSVWPAKSRR